MLFYPQLSGTHCTRSQDKEWLERLKRHIELNINPLLGEYHHGAVEVGDVMKCLDPQACHLVELEVVTVKHLVSKISSSFAASSLQKPDEDGTLFSEAPLHDLWEAPVFLLGVLMSSLQAGRGNLSYTGLMLGDTTGTIPCEVG